MTFFERFEASILNPYLERLQFFMDLSFEGGLPQHWKSTFNDGNSRMVKDHRDIEIVKLKDLNQVFGILFIGYAVAFVTLFFEIFYHDFVKDFQSKFLRLNLYKPKDNLRRRKPKPSRVRRIRVRPINLNYDDEDAIEEIQ